MAHFLGVRRNAFISSWNLNSLTNTDGDKVAGIQWFKYLRLSGYNENSWMVNVQVSSMFKFLLHFWDPFVYSKAERKLSVPWFQKLGFKYLIFIRVQILNSVYPSSRTKAELNIVSDWSVFVLPAIQLY